MLWSLGGCSEPSSPAPPSGPSVVRLLDADHPLEVSGDIQRLHWRTSLRVDDWQGFAWMDGVVAGSLPSVPADEPRVTCADGRTLEQRRNLGALLSKGGFVVIPPRQRKLAPEIVETSGFQHPGSFAPPVPAQLHLRKVGDWWRQAFDRPAESATLRCMIRVGSEGEARLSVSLFSKPIATITAQGTDWKIYEVPIRSSLPRWPIRIELDSVSPPPHSSPVQVSVLWMELVHAGPAQLFVEERSAEGLQLEYESRPPTEVERLFRDPERPQRYTFVSAGGEATLRLTRPLAEIRVDGQLRRQQSAQQSWELGELVGGLHFLELSDPGEVLLQQPLARLIRQGRHRDLELDDQPDGDDPREDSLSLRVLRRFEVQEDRRPAYWVPTDSRVQVDAEARQGDELRFSVGVPDDPPDSLVEEITARIVGNVRTEARARFQLSWKQDDRQLVLLEGSARAGEPWQDHVVSLPPGSGGRGSLVFETESQEPGVSVAWADPRWVRAGSRSSGKNVILYLIDTLRADRLSCYGADRPTSPVLDSLADDGFLFEQCYSVASWTRPSVASVMTGLFPRFHLAGDSHALPKNLLTLAEVFRRENYSTWAAVANIQVSARGLAFEQGFQRFLAKGGLEARSDDPFSHSTSQLINQAMIPWLENHHDEAPFFLYLHSLDPHAPYAPPASFERPFQTEYDGPLRDRPLVPRSTLRPMQAELDAEDLAYVREVYDNEIACQDQSLAQLLEALDRLGLRDDTLLVILSDHGEEFLEHGDWDHGHRMWEELVRVPFLVWMPERWRQDLDLVPRRIRTPVSQVDVASGLVDLLGIADPFPRQGRSWLPLLVSEPEEPWVCYAEESNTLVADELGAVRRGRFKLIWSLNEGQTPRFRLFDLEKDPGEQRDLANERSDVVQAMITQRNRLREQMNTLDSALEAAGFSPVGAGQPVELDAAALEELQALGYLGDD